MLNEVRGRVTKTGHGVVDKYLGPADQATVLATHGAPDQCAVLGIEFLHATIGFDHLRTGYADTPLLRHGERRAASSNQAASTVASRSTTDQADDRHAGEARIDQGTHDFRNGQFASVSLLQAYTTGIE